jgi:hypothetical protein
MDIPNPLYQIGNMNSSKGGEPSGGGGGSSSAGVDDEEEYWRKLMEIFNNPNNTDLLFPLDTGLPTDTNSSKNDLGLQDELLSLLNSKNFSALFKEGTFDALKEPLWSGVIITLYVIVITLGVLFNGIVLYILSRNTNMWNVTNVFIGNLALSDIFICLFNLPFQLYYQLTDNWIFGDVLCHIIFPSFAIPIYVSTLTMLFIATDRYWLIVYPLRNRISLKNAFVSITFALIFSILLCIPMVIFTRTYSMTMPISNEYRNYCYEVWPSVTGRHIYSCVMFVFQFCVPILCASGMYMKIYSRLRNRPMRKSDSRRKHRTNKILISIVLVFCVCWLPWNIFALILELGPHMARGRFIKFTDLLLKVFAMSSACINPFLYGWFNDNFRKEMNQFVVRIHKHQKAYKAKRCRGYTDDVNENDLDVKTNLDPNNTCNFTITIDRLTNADSI